MEPCEDAATDCVSFYELGGCDVKFGDRVYAQESCCKTCGGVYFTGD